MVDDKAILWHLIDKSACYERRVGVSKPICPYMKRYINSFWIFAAKRNFIDTYFKKNCLAPMPLIINCSFGPKRLEHSKIFQILLETRLSKRVLFGSSCLHCTTILRTVCIERNIVMPSVFKMYTFNLFFVSFVRSAASHKLTYSVLA